ncbi:MAG: hypothetical protein HYV35_03030 [Lentisphaerae bacterium]|nr:hypothetical protein [Lentisphaerota bacterium]
MKAKRICLGMAAGIAFGLLFDGILLVNSSGWLIAFIFPVVLPPLLGLIVGLVAGWKALMPSPSWYKVILIAIVSWPIAVLGPIKTQEWRFRRFAEGLPAYHVADRRIQSLGVLGGDDPPSVRVAFETKNVTIPQMVQFYRDHFVNSGWTELEPQKEYKQDIWYKFRRGRYTVSIIGYEGGKWGGMQCVAVSRTYSTFFYR